MKSKKTAKGRKSPKIAPKPAEISENSLFLPDFEVPKFETIEFEVPKFEMPYFESPALPELPPFTIPTISKKTYQREIKKILKEAKEKEKRERGTDYSKLVD